MLDQKMAAPEPEIDTAIRLPASLFERIKDRANAYVGVFFGRYETATLFPVGEASVNSSAPRQIQVCSQVLAATVGQNMSLQNLEHPVRVMFRLLNHCKGGVVSYYRP